MKCHLRTVMLLIALVAFVLGLLRLAESWTVITARGIGFADVPLEFVVLDAVSHQAISDASIELRVPDDPSVVPKAPSSVRMVGGPDGRCGVKLDDLPVSLTYRRRGDKDHSELVSREVKHPEWELRVSASGYRELFVPCEMFRNSYMADPLFHSREEPPPIVIRLKKETR